MSAAEILDRLLADLEAATEGTQGGEPHPLIDHIDDLVCEARMERDRARLIFGEAA